MQPGEDQPAPTSTIAVIVVGGRFRLRAGDSVADRVHDGGYVARVQTAEFRVGAVPRMRCGVQASTATDASSKPASHIPARQPPPAQSWWIVWNTGGYAHL